MRKLTLPILTLIVVGGIVASNCQRPAKTNSAPTQARELLSPNGNLVAYKGISFTVDPALAQEVRSETIPASVDGKPAISGLSTLDLRLKRRLQNSHGRGLCQVILRYTSNESGKTWTSVILHTAVWSGFQILSSKVARQEFTRLRTMLSEDQDVCAQARKLLGEAL